MSSWIKACGLDDIEQEGARRFDHAGRTYAIFR
ncbi:Rieske family ferredoxin, partial [Mesorhizobium sp. M8A.F.Ca.ET.165.01.1.1]